MGNRAVRILINRLEAKKIPKEDVEEENYKTDHETHLISESRLIKANA
jgi:hypothetical protein